MRKIKIWILYLVLSIIALIVAFPFIWLVITSLKTYPDIYHFPIIYWPSEVTWEHYGYVIRLDFLRYFLNSLVIGIGTAVLTIVIAALPSYAFGRLSFRGKRPLLLSILVCQMFPQVTFVIPFFVIFRRLGLINTHLGMMISYLPFTTPIEIWILRNFFQGIPGELEEAAMIDGCTPIQAFVRIIFPLAIPGIAAVAIYAFIFAWGELMFALSYLPSQEMQTIPAFLTLFVGQYQTRWGPLFAGSVIASLPPLIAFIFFQRQFISGLTGGAIKQ
ncbi:MAG TPA: carbohydrate ABC transporter permease [Candidatus Atribacteria bacterium]|nr:carbohydrate ABC transporter permease [Candidatus Atribacteria bacterium]